MNLDWHWIQGRMQQDEALDKFEKAAKELEDARDEWYKWQWWAAWFDTRRN